VKPDRRHRGDERSGLEACDMRRLIEQVVEGRNLRRALKRVQQNESSPGVDGLTVKELPTYLKQHWHVIREHLLTGQYQPSAVKRVQIPKPGGGVRMLGTPTVLDRFIQQAVLQVLQPLVDPPSQSPAMAFGRAVERRTRCVRRSRTCRRVVVGWRTWT